ncbi:hypothetical protein L4R70_26930 [Priestia megaterium]|nr:hypothetical protein [Priestia megaterium]
MDYYTVRADKNLGEIKVLMVSLKKADDDSPVWYLFKVEISTSIAGKQYEWEFPAKIWIAPPDVSPIHGVLTRVFITPFGASDKPPSDGDGGIIIITKDDKNT